MTKHNAPLFISYKRQRADEVAFIAKALGLHGIPVWQDIHDLPHQQTELELRRVLASDEIGGALLFITPEVDDSPIIRNVEIPLAVERAAKDRSFQLIPVLAGGLEYDKADAILAGSLRGRTLSELNVKRLRADPLTDEKCLDLARHALGVRLRAWKQSCGGPRLRAKLNTRVKEGWTEDNDLLLDWKPCFEAGRPANDVAVWNSHLLPALSSLASAVRAASIQAPIQWSGQLSIPTAVAVGASLTEPCGLKAEWAQPDSGSPWTLAPGGGDAGLVVEPLGTKPDGEGIALLLSVNKPVRQAFASSRAGLPKFRVTLHVQLQEGLDTRLDGTRASLVARALAAQLQRARAEFDTGPKLHLFLACPVGLAFLLGQLLNTFGEVVVYEFEPNLHQYRYEVTLSPSG